MMILLFLKCRQFLNLAQSFTKILIIAIILCAPVYLNIIPHAGKSQGANLDAVDDTVIPAFFTPDAVNRARLNFGQLYVFLATPEEVISNFQFGKAKSLGMMLFWHKASYLLRS